MVVKRYPHTATLSYVVPGTWNTIGVYTPGTTVTIGITCNAQPNTTKYILGTSGDKIGYSWDILSPLFTGASSVPDSAKLEFFGKEHIILLLFPYQKHTEIKC